MGVGVGNRIRNAQFVSFLEQSGFRQRLLAREKKGARFARAVGSLAAAALVAGFVWVAIESAQALAYF